MSAGLSIKQRKSRGACRPHGEYSEVLGKSGVNGDATPHPQRWSATAGYSCPGWLRRRMLNRAGPTQYHSGPARPRWLQGIPALPAPFPWGLWAAPGPSSRDPLQAGPGPVPDGKGMGVSRDEDESLTNEPVCVTRLPHPKISEKGEKSPESQWRA